MKGILTYSESEKIALPEMIIIRRVLEKINDEQQELMNDKEIRRIT